MPNKRRQLEERLKEIVLALRAEQESGNITVQVPETSDFIAILRVDPDEAKELQAMLSRPGGGRRSAHPKPTYTLARGGFGLRHW